MIFLSHLLETAALCELYILFLLILFVLIFSLPFVTFPHIHFFISTQLNNWKAPSPIFCVCFFLNFRTLSCELYLCEHLQTPQLNFSTPETVAVYLLSCHSLGHTVFNPPLGNKLGKWYNSLFVVSLHSVFTVVLPAFQDLESLFHMFYLCL